MCRHKAPRNRQSATVRQARPLDTETVHQISREAYTAAYLPVIGVVPKPGIEDYRPYIERGEVWILEADDEPIGVIVLEEKSDFLLVYSVAVKPRHQRNGHATTLLGFADQHALAIGVKAVRLYTNQRMERNIGLYRRCGFTEIAKRPHPSRPGEVLVDMEKTIQRQRGAG
jgi:ribosomal protein S18 acetylase RimI-like enzyme